jgi:DNA (cytosine-5)-methyltransferase 1
MKIGSLFSGAGMLDKAVEAVFDAETVWFSEIDPAASKVLAYHHPHIPNLGDITKVDWTTVQPVDILCGGFPCQDVSAAGKQAGLQAGTRSGLWSVFVEAIDVLQPKIVVIENVKGLLSAKATRSAHVESNGSGVGNTDRSLRAAGAVLGDLSERGYDAKWCTVPASDAGAPHRRERVFILAYASGQ